MLFFDRNIVDGRAMMCSIFAPTIGNDRGMGDVEYGTTFKLFSANVTANDRNAMTARGKYALFQFGLLGENSALRWTATWLAALP